MEKQFKYTIVIEGIIPAKDENQASKIVNMGYAVLGRLLQSPNKILVAVANVTEEVKNKQEELIQEKEKVNSNGRH